MHKTYYCDIYAIKVARNRICLVSHFDEPPYYTQTPYQRKAVGFALVRRLDSSEKSTTFHC